MLYSEFFDTTYASNPDALAVGSAHLRALLVAMHVRGSQGGTLPLTMNHAVDSVLLSSTREDEQKAVYDLVRQGALSFAVSAQAPTPIEAAKKRLESNHIFSSAPWLNYRKKNDNTKANDDALQLRARAFECLDRGKIRLNHAPTEAWLTHIVKLDEAFEKCPIRIKYGTRIMANIIRSFTRSGRRCLFGVPEGDWSRMEAVTQDLESLPDHLLNSRSYLYERYRIEGNITEYDPGQFRSNQHIERSAN